MNFFMPWEWLMSTDAQIEMTTSLLTGLTLVVPLTNTFVTSGQQMEDRIHYALTKIFHTRIIAAV